MPTTAESITSAATASLEDTTVESTWNAPTTIILDTTEDTTVESTWKAPTTIILDTMEDTTVESAWKAPTTIISDIPSTMAVNEPLTRLVSGATDFYAVAHAESEEQETIMVSGATGFYAVAVTENAEQKSTINDDAVAVTVAEDQETRMVSTLGYVPETPYPLNSTAPVPSK